MRPADHGSALEQGHNLSISRRPFKGLNLHISFLPLIFAAIITQQAALWVQKLEYVCSILSFGPSCVGCLQDSHLTWVFLVSLIASYLLWNWMKPQAENCLSGLRLMLRVLVGWTDTQEDISASVLKEGNNKIWKLISPLVLSVLNIFVNPFLQSIDLADSKLPIGRVWM